MDILRKNWLLCRCLMTRFINRLILAFNYCKCIYKGDQTKVLSTGNLCNRGLTYTDLNVLIVGNFFFTRNAALEKVTQGWWYCGWHLFWWRLSSLRWTMLQLTSPTVAFIGWSGWSSLPDSIFVIWSQVLINCCGPLKEITSMRLKEMLWWVILLKFWKSTMYSKSSPKKLLKELNRHRLRGRIASCVNNWINGKKQNTWRKICWKSPVDFHRDLCECPGGSS